MFDLSGKVAIVSGCNTGLGQGMALALAQAGCDIVGLNIVPANETAAAVEQMGRRFKDIPTDLSVAKAEDLITRATAAFGRIDILVNNASIIRRADALEFSERDWDEVIAVDLKAVFFLAQAAARQFLRQQTAGLSKGGRIINTASLLRPGRRPRALLHRGQERRARADPAARQRVGEIRHHRQRDRAGLHGHRQHSRAARRRRTQQEILAAFPSGRWGLPRTSRGRWCSWPRKPRPTSPVTPSPSTEAGSRAEALSPSAQGDFPQTRRMFAVLMCGCLGPCSVDSAGQSSDARGFFLPSHNASDGPSHFVAAGVMNDIGAGVDGQFVAGEVGNDRAVIFQG